jgi:hypothetical protein
MNISMDILGSSLHAGMSTSDMKVDQPQKPCNSKIEVAGGYNNLSVPPVHVKTNRKKSTLFLFYLDLERTPACLSCSDIAGDCHGFSGMPCQSVQNE